MTKRRSHPIGTGKGRHGSEVQPAGKRPPGEVKPIISKSKHGKMTQQYHDTDERPITDGCAGILAAIIALMLLFPRCGHGQSPDVEFKSLFQIRYAMPDTIQILHVGHNIRLDKSGVECVPINPKMGTMPAIPVQSWLQGDNGEWIGVTKSGGTVTLWDCCGDEMHLQIASGTQEVYFYNMAPSLLTLKGPDKM